MPKSLKDIFGGLGGLFSERKVPKSILKNAGNVFSKTKTITPTASPAEQLVEIPFSGQYDVTLIIKAPEFGSLPPQLVPLTPIHSKISLEGNGHPLILPLGDIHPGWAGSVPLNVSRSFETPTTGTSAQFASGVGGWWGLPIIGALWRGTCAADGSAFSFEFDYVGIPLEGTITGLRSTEN